MRTRILLALAILLHVATACADPVTVTVTFRVPIEMASHGFTLDQIVSNHAVSHPVSYTGIADTTFGPSAFLELTAEVRTDLASGIFWLHDVLMDATSDWSGNNPPPSLIAFPTWHVAAGKPNTYFALKSARSGDTLCLKSDTGFIFPVQSGLAVTLPLSNSTTGAYAIFNAWAQVPSNSYYGNSFRIFDLTTAEVAPDATNLANPDPALAWTPQTGGLPTVPVVIILPDAEAGNRFVLHTSANSQEGFDAGPATIADQDKKAVVQGLVGLGNVFWLVRSDGVSSPAYAVAQSGSEVDLSQAGYFPADYMPAWASTLFRIGGARAGHSFTVRHLNGIQVPFPIPANLWTGHVTTPNSDGATVDRQFY